VHSQVYSQRLGAIAPGQFQAALDRFQLGRFVRAEAIPFGLFGQNVFVSSSTGEYVLRGAPHLAWQFPVEQFFADRLHERTPVPVPWPYQIDSSQQIFGWSYALMPRLPGLQLADPQVYTSLSAEDRRGIARALGENLARMQQHTRPFPGRYDPTTKTVQPLELRHELEWPFPTSPEKESDRASVAPPAYADLIVDRIRHWLGRVARYNAKTPRADIAWVEALIARAGTALHEPFQPCLVMEDYKRANTSVSRANGAWEVSGLFDLMEMHFGDGEADLSRPVAEYLDSEPESAGEFVRAYADAKPLRPGFARRFPIYMLHDRLIIWEYAQRTGAHWWPEQFTFREWVERYVSFPAGTLLRAAHRGGPTLKAEG
jgi:hygromycin-B 7''-O-kinase